MRTPIVEEAFLFAPPLELHYTVHRPALYYTSRHRRTPMRDTVEEVDFTACEAVGMLIVCALATAGGPIAAPRHEE